MGVLSSIFPKRGAQSGASYRDGVSDELVEQTRARARNRLLGAAVLVLLGVVILPMLFDTEPRSLSENTRIEVARAPMAAEASKPEEKPVVKAAAKGTEAPRASADTAPAATTASASSSTSTAVRAETATPPAPPIPVERKPAPAAAVNAESPRELRSEAKSPPKPEPHANRPEHEAAATKPPARPTANAERTADARARALLEGREPAAKAAASHDRFVVQVAAYADQASMSAARSRLDKLGLKTYTQDVKTSSGPRIRLRVGPFVDRAEAERALARIKGAGLPGSVLTL